MVNFIQSADCNIKINEDVSYLLNDALHVNAMFTASAIVETGKPVLRVNLPNIGKHAKLIYYKPSPDSTPTAATVKDTVSNVDGIHNITIYLSANTDASQVYHIEGWIKLP